MKGKLSKPYLSSFILPTSSFALLPCRLRAVCAFGELFYHLFVEGGDVVGLAAGDESVVRDDLFVNPLRARVNQVGLDGRPGGHRAAFDRARFDERPGAVADCRDGLARVEERLDEGDGLG